MKNLALLSSIVNTCLKDVLMDDISNPEIAIIGNAHRNINLLGGDYGVDSKKTHMTFHKSTASHDGYISIIPTLLQTQTHPNFFFSKLNKDSHFDLRGYSALHFNLKVHDLKDSADSYDASVCLTQKSNDGKEIVHGGESTYESMSNYVEGGVIRANTDYSVRMPLTAFSKRTNPKNGGEFFDFMHFKDFTWNNFQPVNVDYRFSNFLLVGNCSDSLIGVKDKQLDGEQAQEDLEDTTVGTELNTSPSPSPTSSQVGLYSVGSFILGSLFTLLL